MRRFPFTATVLAVVAAGGIVAAQSKKALRELSAEDRVAILRHSQVWSPIDTASVDIKAGPPGAGGFAPGAAVTCDFVDKKLSGSTPKFACAVAPEDDVKVKYGLRNGEVYGEVAATRLLWALGFGADRMYPVRVICRGCPKKLGGRVGERGDEWIFDPAAIERKAAGKVVETRAGEGWSWKELDLVEAAAGGAPVAHRDALKLAAVFMQHGDNKPQQQRLVCLDKELEKEKAHEKRAGNGELPGIEEPEPEGGELCLHPFMLINDLGLTFGRVDILNRDTLEGVNFERWSRTPIWKSGDACVGNLPKSLTGSLHDPVISEAGRQFLADRLAKLSDAQIRDLFDVARFQLRTADTPSLHQEHVTIDDWVTAFKNKRDEIASRRCPAG
jgi:hypothetical protein